MYLNPTLLKFLIVIFSTMLEFKKLLLQLLNYLKDILEALKTKTIKLTLEDKDLNADCI